MLHEAGARHHVLPPLLPLREVERHNELHALHLACVAGLPRVGMYLHALC